MSSSLYCVATVTQKNPSFANNHHHRSSETLDKSILLDAVEFIGVMITVGDSEKLGLNVMAV